MIPTILHTIWLGEAPPTIIRDCIRSVGERHPDWSRIIWDDKLLTAVGFDIPFLKEQLGTWASVTNWLRLKLLHQFGGIYLDADVQAVGNLAVLVGHKAFAAPQDGDRICNAVIGAEPNHPWVKWQIGNFETFNPRDAASGVYLATAAPRDDFTIIPRDWVYPWLWDAPPEARVLGPGTLLIHHWLKSWAPTP